MAGSSHRTRLAVTLGVVAAAIAAVVVVGKCDGGGGKPTSAKVTTAGSTASSAAGARLAPVDPRTTARVAIHGVVRAKGGGPIAGAQVCIRGYIERVSPDEFRDPRCTPTDAAGAYGFDQLLAGHYGITASAATFQPGAWRGPAPERRDTLELTAGQRRDDIDLVLAPGGVEVKGTVSDINGGPIAEAWVEVESTRGWWGGGGGAYTRTTADGAFTTWAAPGAISGTATADGYASGSKAGTAPTSKLDILLTPESVLAGTVVAAESGEPVAGASVSVNRDGFSDDGFSFSWGGPANAISDEHGRFRITRLAPGRYKPSAEAIGRFGEPAESVMLGLGQIVEGVVIPVHAVQVVAGRIVIDDGSGKLAGCERGWLSLRGKNQRMFSGTTESDGTVRIDAVVPGTYKTFVRCDGFLEEDEYPELVVGAADVTGQEWKVKAGGAIAGVVKTKAGAPIADAYVTARTVGGDPRGQRSWEGERTEDDGTFRVRGIAPGEYQLEPVADGYPAPKDPVKVMVAVGADTPAEIVLDDGGAIAGVVVDERGTPVADADVEASGDRWEWNGGWDKRSGDDGTFTIDGLRPGSYRVSASRGWSDRMRRPGTTDDDVQGERATVTAGQTARVRLVVESRTGTIAGTVVDAAGAPIADAYLATDRESDSAGAIAGGAVRGSRWGGWGKKPVVTDAGGGFQIADLSPGTYTLRAYRKGGGEAIAEHVKVGTRNAKLVMKPTASIAGVVRTKDGATPDEVRVSVVDQKLGFSRSEQFFRTGGAFKLAELPPGTFVVTASSPAGQVDQTVTLAEGEARTGVVLELEARVTITGRLVALDDGTPVPGMQVLVNPIKGGGGMRVYFGGDDKQTITAADGKFTVEDAPAGRVYVSAWPVDWDTATFGPVRVPRTLAGESTIDVGDLAVPRRRLPNPRDRGGDLGFDIKEQPPDIEPEDRKLEISRLRPDGPAVGTGLVVGDVITSVDGTDITGANSYLSWSLLGVPAGTTVKLGVARGATISITAVPPP